VEDLRGLRVNKSHFETVHVIGCGAFGEVRLVQHKASGQRMALKILSKQEMVNRYVVAWAWARPARAPARAPLTAARGRPRSGARSKEAFYWEERDILARAASPWVPQLEFAFQDDQALYLAMEFLPCGNLYTLQEAYDIPEEYARFYAAELLLALDAVHRLGYIHRDVKPENVLMAASGHIKLADFGSCIRVGAGGRVKVFTAVGTPDYISPEVRAAAKTPAGRF
jgi:Rho-associated protein kinase 2